MKNRALEKKLGVDPGASLTALIELAERVSPSTPWDAFEPLWLRFPWLKQGASAASMRCSTPKNVHPFAETGGDLNHFGFLLDGDLPTDERPIVFVVPKDGDEATQIVAPNLRSFLGLVAVAFGEVVSRSATDEQWATFRRAWYGDDPERLAEMDRLSAVVCSIPGVVRPVSPSRVANACPNQTFVLVDESVAPEPRRLELELRIRAERDRLVALADGMIDGRVLDRASLARAKEEATSSLIASLDALAAAEQEAASATVTRWRSESMLWKTMVRGGTGDLATLLARYEAPPPRGPPT